MYLGELFVNLFITIDQSPVSMGLIELLIMFILIAPIVEELIFRFVLRYRIFFNKLRVSREIWNKIFPFLVYFITIAFGFSHYINYNNNSLAFYLMLPIITLPQIILGFMIAFLRVKFNFIWGLVLHILWNILAISFSIITFLPTSTYNVTTDNYRLESQALLSYQWEKDSSFSAELTHDGKLKKINTEQYPLTEVLEVLTEKDFVGKDELVNINFDSRDGVAIDEFVDIILQKYKIKKQGDKPLDELIIKTDDYSLILNEKGYVDSVNKTEVEYIKSPNGRLLFKLNAKSVSLQSVMDAGMAEAYASFNSYDEYKIVDIDFESEEGVSEEDFVKLIQTKFDIEKY